MKRTAYIHLLLLLLLAPLPIRAQQHIASRWSDDGRTLTVEYRITPRQPGSDYAYMVTPLLCSSQGDTLTLSTATWRGKRNAKKLERTLYFQGIRGELPPYIEAADTTTRTFTHTVDATRHPWVREQALRLCFLNDVEGCCQVEQDQVEGTPFIYLPPYQPMLTQVEDRTGQREELHTSYVHFPLNSAVLDPDFGQNKAVLDSILHTTRLMLKDGTSAVERIQIIGQASPDGPVARNQWLGEHRARALRNYICRQLEVSPSLFTIINGGEGWTDLRTHIATSTLPERDTLLAIIDNEPDVDKRESRIKRLHDGRTYDHLRQHVLPAQRNSGSMNIRYVRLTDEVAPVINRATELIRAGQYAQAIAMLEPVAHDPRTLHTLATACYHTGQTARAISLLARAAQTDPHAAANLKLIQERERRKQLVKGE